MEYSKELKSACDVWIRKFKRMSFSEECNPDAIYAAARDSIKKNNAVSAKAAHALLEDYFDHDVVGGKKEWRLGVFTSAVYNHRCTDEVIVFDVALPKPVRDIARNLTKNKVFVNKSACGDSVGVYSKGPVLNYGAVGNDFCFGAEGPVLNYGGAGFQMASSSKNVVVNAGKTLNKLAHASSGVCFNCGETGDNLGECSEGIVVNSGKAGDSAGLCADGVLIFLKACASYLYDIEPGVWNPRVLLPEQCQKIPAIVMYFESLQQKIEVGKTNMTAAIALARSLDSAGIKKCLEQIINM